ncbi:MAG: SIS domain-containing protein [Bacteroidota bacterium]
MSELRELIAREIEALQNIPLDGGIERAVQLMHETAAEKGGKIVVSGVGKAGHIGLQLAAMLSSTGSPACFISPLEAQHGDLGLLQPNDLLFCISNSGMTREIVELVGLAQGLFPDLPFILLTKNAQCDLAQQAAAAILTGPTQEICPLDLTPTTSTTVMAVIVDLLVVSLMKRRNFTKEMFARRHHGGYLGKKSRS